MTITCNPITAQDNSRLPHLYDSEKRAWIKPILFHSFAPPLVSDFSLFPDLSVYGIDY